jgi:RsiW-degrading membrane proteinase PrsW (M82 family)
MNLDLRVLIPFVLPFVVLGFLRLMFWLAGAPWTEPAVAAVCSVVIGSIFGGAAMALLFVERISIGSIRIGKARDAKEGE